MFKRQSIAPGAALLLALSASGALCAQEPDQVTVQDLAGARPKLSWDGARAKARTAAGTNPTGAAGLAGIPGIDSLTNFNGQFTATGFDPYGNPNTHWLYNMVGTTPESNTTTVINAPIIPVSLDLRNFDGTPRFVNGQRLFSDATQYVRPVLHSPVFQNSRYSSSETPTQITDAVQRAEFGDRAGRQLAHSVEPTREEDTRDDADPRNVSFCPQRRWILLFLRVDRRKHIYQFAIPSDLSL